MSGTASEGRDGPSRPTVAFRRRQTNQPSRGRPLGLIVLAVAFVLGAISRLVASLLTDAWWFADLRFGSVFRTQVLTTIGLFVVGAVIVGGLGIAVVHALGRAAPSDPPDAMALRMWLTFGRRPTLAAVAAISGLIVVLAPALAHNTSIALLMLHGNGNAGPRDPVLNRPLGFYLFELPFLRALTGWFLSVAALFVVVLIVGAHMVGAWRPGEPGGRLPSSLRRWVSIFAANWFVLRGIGFLLDRWHLVASGSGYVDGPGATDLRTRMPGLLILAGISFLVAVAILYGATKHDLVVPGVAVAVSLVATLILGQLVPRVYAQLEVKPNSPGIERRPIQRNVDATRAAYGLSEVFESTLVGAETSPSQASPAVVRRVSNELVDNARIWGPVGRTSAAFNKVLSVDYLRVLDVDMDRYMIDSREQLVAVGAVDRFALPGETWSQRHLERTHGYGVMVAPAGEVVGEGEPKLVSTGLRAGAVSAKQPRLYFGEGTDAYAIVGTSAEVDPIGSQRSRHVGRGGVSVGGFVKKAVFALRFGDRNLLVRSVPANARVMYVRDVRARAEKLAPFLRYGADPYPVVLRDRVVWVLDGYTVTNNYPYAQRFNTDAALDPRSGLANGGFNSVRAAVRVVIDGYDGDVTMYRMAPVGSDLILDAWAKAYPGLFRASAQLERDRPGLTAHLRYPEDLFRLQSLALGRYHVNTSAEFVDPANDWTPSLAAPSTSDDKASSGSLAPAAPASTAVRRAEDRAQVDPDAESNVADPLYLRHRYPGQSAASFVLQQTLELRRSTSQRRLLRSVIVADVGADNPGGRLRLLRIPASVEVLGPAQAFDRMRANPKVSTLETQLGQVGSKVNFGDVQVLPTEAGVIYQRPLFLKPEASVIEELKYVLVLAGSKVTIEPSLRSAFSTALGVRDGVTPSVPSTSGTNPSTVNDPPPSTSGQSSEQLLRAASDALDAADAALKSGDLGLYQKRVDEARSLLAEAQGLPAKAPSSASATTSTTVP